MEPFTLPYFREALAEILLLAVPGGLIGSWVVLRGLAFQSHAVGTATFPGLVLAAGIGFAALSGAFAAALAFTAFTALAGRSRQTGSDAVTAIALTACLAAGVILASDVFASGANVDTLLFGSLLAIGPGDLWLAAATTVLVLLATLVLGQHWLARGFDPDAASGPRTRAPWSDGLLLVTVAVVVVSGLAAAGALLVSALVVVPAATVRLVAGTARGLQLGSVLLVAAEGTLGLWLSARTNAPPGATIAVVSGAVFLLVFGGRRLVRRQPGRRLLAAVASVVVLGAVVATAGGCRPDEPPGTGPNVVATTTQVGDLVRQVGGREVRLTTLLRPNTDPHEYEPRPSDVGAIADATLIFRSGGPLDDWTGNLTDAGGAGGRTVDLDRELPVRLPGEDGTDPHWWQDPVNAAAAARRIAMVLARQNPPQSAYYRARARRFESDARKLTTRVRTCLRKVPADQRRIVTDHDAFGYFTTRFGIETAGSAIPALASRAAPSAGELADLERIIRRQRVKAVFPEHSSNPALAKAVARDTGARVGELLYGDSLGPAGSPGETLLGALKMNADSLIAGMSGGRVDCFGDENG